MKTASPSRPTGETRRLAAIMFTDMVGFSRTTGRWDSDGRTKLDSLLKGLEEEREASAQERREGKRPSAAV